MNEKQIEQVLEACFSEFCEHIGDSPCGCDACPYKDENSCRESYIKDKMKYLQE